MNFFGNPPSLEELINRGILSNLSHIDSSLNMVRPHLFIGSIFSLNPSNLAEKHITLVINCTKEETVSIPGVEKMQIPVDDSRHYNIGYFFDNSADMIHLTSRLGGRTLVHCNAGVSRSATICMAYLMKYEGMKLKDAFNDLKACRPMIRPNEAFFEQLIDFEKKLFGSNSVHMINMPFGRIPDVYQSTYLAVNPDKNVVLDKMF